ncbi:hypothetical protein AgCh_017370 [Apium graveolens]
MTKLPICERIGNVPQFPVGVDVVIAEFRLRMKPIQTRVVKKRVKLRDPLVPRVFIPIPEESFEMPE